MMLLKTKDLTNTNKPTSNLVSIKNNFYKYMDDVKKFPLITAEDEYKLIFYFKKSLDIKIINILVVTHLRFVVKISKYYIGYGFSLNDLIQEGSIGLIKSIRNIKLNNNTRLVTFSIHWIKTEIHNYILKNWKIVRIVTSKIQRKLFFRLHRENIERNYYIKKEISGLSELVNKNNLDINNTFAVKKLTPNIKNLDSIYLFIEQTKKKILARH